MHLFRAQNAVGSPKHLILKMTAMCCIVSMVRNVMLYTALPWYTHEGCRSAGYAQPTGYRVPSSVKPRVISNQ